jgi:predicted RNase H-like HicB family nuclease
MSTPRTLTAAVHQEEDWYVAQCLEVDVASQGQSVDEALATCAKP